MFTYLKILPFIILLASAGYAAHKFIVNQLNTQIVQLQTDIRQYQAQNAVLQSAAAINERTIKSLEEQISTQLSQLNNLTVSNQQLQTEKEEYLSIFRRHDLQRLAIARPGLIEPRINNGTQEVFRQVEQDSKEVSK